MSSELDATDKELLKDIQAFNRNYSATGWHLADKVVTEDLSRIALFRSSMMSVQFLHVDWKSAMLTDCEFTNVEFQQAQFTGAKLWRVVFKDCKFVLCSFAKATLTDCSFINCTAEELNARDAEFEGCVFEGFEDDSGVYGSAALRNCRFERGRMDNSSFYSTKFNAVSVKQSTIENAIFADIQGTDLSFEDATIQDCSFEGSRFGSVTFERGQSQGVTFKEFNAEKIGIRNCAKIEALTVRDSTFAAAEILDCPSVSELTINKSQMKDLTMERNQIAYFEMEETEVSGDSRIVDCPIAGLNLQKSTLLGMTMANCAVAMYLIADGATLNGVAMDGMTYAPGLQLRTRGVNYLNGSAEFGGR